MKDTERSVNKRKDDVHKSHGPREAFLIHNLRFWGEERTFLCPSKYIWVKVLLYLFFYVWKQEPFEVSFYLGFKILSLLHSTATFNLRRGLQQWAKSLVCAQFSSILFFLGSFHILPWNGSQILGYRFHAAI